MPVTPYNVVIANANPRLYVALTLYQLPDYMPERRTPFQGESLFNVYPGLKRLGYPV
jgi:hypothetical protein